jgi:Zn-dependent protease with chaperone function
MKGRFSRAPRIGIAIWFALFLSSFLAVITAFVVAVILSLHWRETLGDANLPFPVRLLFAFWPWILLALGGVTLALTTNRVEPWLDKRSSLVDYSITAVIDSYMFHGVRIEVVPLQIPLAMALDQPSLRILLTSEVLAQLSGDELEAVLWHEWAHIKQRHNQLKSAVRFVTWLTTFIKASRLMNVEVDRLCEAAADRVAIARVGAIKLKSARTKLQIF